MVSQTYIIFLLLFTWCPKRKSSSFSVYMVSQTYIIFLLLFTWCPKHISTSFSCLHGVPNIYHLSSPVYLVSQTKILFFLLFTWSPKCKSSSFSCLHGVPNIYPVKNNRLCYYLHSSFTGCPKHTLSSFFFYRELKCNKSDGKLIISVKTFKTDISNKYSGIFKLSLISCLVKIYKCWHMLRTWLSSAKV